MSEIKNNKSITDADELLKALADLDITIEPQDIKKSETTEEVKDEKIDGGEGEPKEEEVKKSLVEEVEELKKSLADKEAELSLQKSETEDLDKKKEETLQKSEVNSVDIIKGITASFNEQIESIKSSINDNSDLQKSISDLSEKLDTLTESVNLIGNTPQGRKSATNYTFLEKAESPESKDEDGKTVLHISKDKEQISKAMESVYDMETDEIKKGMYGDALASYVAGNAEPSQGIVRDLFTNHNIRLVK